MKLPPGIHILVCSFPHSGRVGLCDQKYRSDGESPRVQGIKVIGSALLSWTLHSQKGLHVVLWRPPTPSGTGRI